MNKYLDLSPNKTPIKSSYSHNLVEKSSIFMGDNTFFLF